MRILIIGSTQYPKKFKAHRALLRTKNHNVRIPNFDSFEGTELQMCCENRSLIEWADEIHIIWDGRSAGTIFDMGMAYALRKPWKLIYLEPKTFANLIRQHEDSWMNRKFGVHSMILEGKIKRRGK